MASGLGQRPLSVFTVVGRPGSPTYCAAAAAARPPAARPPSAGRTPERHLALAALAASPRCALETRAQRKSGRLRGRTLFTLNVLGGPSRSTTGYLPVPGSHEVCEWPAEQVPAKLPAVVSGSWGAIDAPFLGWLR